MQGTTISIHNLQRSFGGVSILKGIDAQVNPGQVIALLGNNGAGKTTLLETLLGFGAPSFGEVNIWGVKATDIRGEIKQKIGFVPQQDELLYGFNGRQHLALFKAFRSHWNQQLVDKLIAEWLIPMDTVVGKMSVGQRQKLSILLAIAHEPALLVLDEPVASLDPIARRQFLQQLIEISADENRTIVFSTHIVSDVERVANQVWMLRHGNLVYQGELDTLKESIARLVITAANPLPPTLDIPNTIKQKVSGNQAVVTVESWSAKQKLAIEKKFAAQVTVEHLSLEDIFLDMNSAGQ